MKKFLSILLLLCFAFSFSVCAFAAGDPDAADSSEPIVSGTEALVPVEEPEAAPAEAELVEATEALTPMLTDGGTESTPTYTVTFNTYGVCEAPDDQQVVSGGLVTEPEDMPELGNGFAGWYVFEKDDKYEWDFEYSEVTSDITLTAVYYWQVNFSTSELCDSPASQVVETGDYITRPEDPTGEGLTFVTWYIFDEDGTKTIWDFDSDKVWGDVTLEASFLIRELTGVSITDRAVLSLPMLSLGHYYLARFRSESGAAKTVDDMVLSSEDAETADTQELLDHAIYTWSVYPSSSFRVEDGDTIYLVLTDRMKEISDTWVLNIFDCISVEAINEKGEASNKDYVSQVCTLACPYCYIVTINDGINDTYGYYYFLGDKPKLEDPEREGYNFGGWYLDEACTTAYNGEGISKSITLYAKWTPISTERDHSISLRTGSALPVACALLALSGTVVGVVASKKHETV